MNLDDEVSTVLNSITRVPSCHPTVCFRLAVPLITASFFLLLVTLTFLATLVQIVCLPILVLSQEQFYRVNSFLAGCLWFFCDSFMSLMGANISLSSLSRIPKGENALVISNHRFFGDFFLLHHFAIAQSMLPFCRYFAKDSIKFIPVFGWGIYMMGSIMLKRDWARDEKKIKDTFELYLTNELPIWIISFVEGSRFTREKLHHCNAFAKSKGLPLLSHLLVPRTKGFVAAIDTFKRGGSVHSVYITTLIYWHPKRPLGSTPTVSDFLLGRLHEFRFHVHTRRFDISEIPESAVDVASWLINQYTELDTMLERVGYRLHS